MNTKLKLTPELQQQIVASIRAGAYPYIAAEAWGVDEKTFDSWMRLGHNRGGRKPYSDFYKEVTKAKAQARLRAEMKMFEEEPKAWLRNGPGREQPDKPGWAAMTKPITSEEEKAKGMLNSPEFLQFMQTLRLVLSPFPAAVAALAAALESKFGQDNQQQKNHSPNLIEVFPDKSESGLTLTIKP